MELLKKIYNVLLNIFTEEYVEGEEKRGFYYWLGYYMAPFWFLWFYWIFNDDDG